MTNGVLRPYRARRTDQGVRPARLNRELPGRHRRDGFRQSQARRRSGAGALFGDRIVGVDRLDYTKGLPQKFKAFGRLLDKYPHYQRQVVLTQIAAANTGQYRGLFRHPP